MGGTTTGVGIVGYGVGTVGMGVGGAVATVTLELVTSPRFIRKNMMRAVAAIAKSATSGNRMARFMFQLQRRPGRLIPIRVGRALPL